MAKLGSFRRIYKQDYEPQFQDMIETLSITVNDSFDSVFQALTNQITLADNINCTLTTFTATLNSDTTPLSGVTIKLNSYQKNVNGIIVLNASCTAQGIFPTSTPYIDYTINQTNPPSKTGVTPPLTLNVNRIIGLPVGRTFNITALVL